MVCLTIAVAATPMQVRSRSRQSAMKVRKNHKVSRPAPSGAGQFLRAVPYVNESLALNRRSGGGAVAEVPLENPRYLVPPLSWLLPFSGKRRIELDAVGLAVLEMCDSHRSVEKIVEKFAADHKLSFREAQLPVTQFLRQLTRRGIVVLVGKTEDTDKL